MTTELSVTSAAPALGTAITPERDLAARNRLVIGVLLVSTFVVILNETLIGVAIPRFIRIFGITADAAQWLSSAFLLTMAVVIPITGFLLQRFSTRIVFVAAMSFFSAGTLLAATAPGFDVLLVARVIQACGTAIMFPLLMTTIMAIVPAQSRGRTMGNIAIAISVAPAIGPSVSGLILNWLEWRWLFLLVLPIALGALVLGAVRIPNVGEPRRLPFDAASVLLAIVGFGGLVYALSNLGSAGAAGAALRVWVPLALGLAGIAVFVLRQLRLQRTDRALLDLRTFRVQAFSLGMGMLFAIMVVFYGVVIVLPIYLQSSLGLSVLQTGLLLLPGGLLQGFLAPFVGRLYDRFGSAWLLRGGAILSALTLWAMTTFNQATPVALVFVAYLLLSVCMTMLFTPLMTASLGALPGELYSHGSATLGTVQQVAGASGTALLVAILAAGGRSDVASAAASAATGVHWAFLAAAALSLIAVPLAFLLRIAAPSGKNGADLS